MDKLSLFNIGFRCENISQALKNYNKTQKINELIISDSESIIHDCFAIKEQNYRFLSNDLYGTDELVPVIFEYFKKNVKNIDEAIITLNEIEKTIKNISKAEQTNVKKAVNFFEEIAEICLIKSNRENINTNYVSSL